jgi:hypothetical protein
MMGRKYKYTEFKRRNILNGCYFEDEKVDSIIKFKFLRGVSWENEKWMELAQDRIRFGVLVLV